MQEASNFDTKCSENTKSHYLKANHTNVYQTTLSLTPLHGETALIAQGLLIDDSSRSHSDTPHLVGPLWTGIRPVAWTSTYTTYSIHKTHTCLRWDSNPQGSRFTPQTAQPLGSSTIDTVTG
jgi:hypothetical protein